MLVAYDISTNYANKKTYNVGLYKIFLSYGILENTVDSSQSQGIFTIKMKYTEIGSHVGNEISLSEAQTLLIWIYLLSRTVYR
jgi:hypothetical protein